MFKPHLANSIESPFHIRQIIEYHLDSPLKHLVFALHTTSLGDVHQDPRFHFAHHLIYYSLPTLFSKQKYYALSIWKRSYSLIDLPFMFASNNVHFGLFFCNFGQFFQSLVLFLSNYLHRWK